MDPVASYFTLTHVSYVLFLLVLPMVITLGSSVAELSTLPQDSFPLEAFLLSTVHATYTIKSVHRGLLLPNPPLPRSINN